MSYTGDVEVGGPCDVRTLETLTIRKAAVGELNNNSYLLTCSVTGAQILIDAAADPQRLLRLIREGSADQRLDAIVTTHSHHDHVGALPTLVASTSTRTIAGADDAANIPTPTKQKVADGDVIKVGVHDLHVIGLRGHTPGSIAIAYRGREGEGDHVFTGDSLFPGGVGATRGDATRFHQLITDVSERIFDRFGDTTWIYPGHGSDTTLGADRPSLPEWRERGW